MANYSFVVADDHIVVRKGLAFFIESIYPFSTIRKVSTFKEVIKLVSAEKIDLLILDVNFPDGTSLSLVPTIKELQPTIKILIFSAFDEDVYAMRYLNAGANGYLNKLCGENDLKEAINTVLVSGRYVSQNIQNKVLDSVIFKKPENPFEQLSNREIEIAKLFVEGFGNNYISEVLNIGKSTVSTYKNRIFEKLDINSLAALISLYNIHFHAS